MSLVLSVNTEQQYICFAVLIDFCVINGKENGSEIVLATRHDG